MVSFQALITRTCGTPDVLLHYFQKRITILSAKEDYYGNELDLFSAYLDSRLHRNNIGKPDVKMDMIVFAGYSEQYDRLMKYDRGEITEKPDIRLNVPDEISSILNELRRRADSGSRHIAFALLELDNELLNTIAKTVSELKNQHIPDRIFRRGTFATDEIAVSIIASNSSSLGELHEKTRQRVLIEKYRRKLNKSMGFGIVCLSGGTIFEVANYAEFEWTKDTVMEQAIEEEAPFVPAQGVKLPGVNQVCICGSGKKFKKCCKRKIDDSRFKMPSR